ncbi:MAG: hypothetical protein QOE63_1396, partial [Acidimicrobiaceae bacterium]
AAAAAAHAMLASLHAMRREHRGEGLAKLDMSVGVHTGVLHAFLAGGSHRELLLAGPTVSGALALESLAEAGEILVSDDVAAHLKEGEVDETARTGLLLRRAPIVPLVAPPAVVDDVTDAGRGLPEVVRHHLDGTRHEGEHRPSTVAFLKYGGTDRAIAELGPAAVSERFDALIGYVQEACAVHGVTFLGTDVDRDGGKVLLAAGTPTASPDDEDRMLLALRDVVDRFRELPVRAGVNRGRIFAVDLGSPARRTFTVMGDAVNLAARVMGQARWGEIVATQHVLDRRRTDFELLAMEPFMVKGKSQPINAQVVGRARGRLDEVEESTTPLIGRTAEMAVIRDALAQAHEGRGSVIQLIGEPGIGKSRLVAAVKALEHGLTRFTFEAGRYSLATPYFALRRGMHHAMGLRPNASATEVEVALRAVVADAAPDLEPWIPLLGIPLGLELPDTPTTASVDPTNRQASLQTAVVDLMQRVLSTPTLLTIEDSHWLDSASSELLTALLEDVDRRPWAVVVTRRDELGGMELLPSPALTSIRLEPLAEDLAASLARATVGGVDLPPGIVDELVERSGGNPLFLQELLLAAVNGSLDEVPDTVEAVVAANIDTLPARGRSVLRHAAVLGGQFPLPVLAPMLDVSAERVSEEIGALDHFLALDANGVVRFRHILLRDVAYEGLPFRARRALHERAGTILERSTDRPDTLAELLSIHFDRAGRYRESWRYSRVAGVRAQRNGAPVEAAAFYERALDAARRLGDIDRGPQAEVAERLGDTWELGGRYEQASRAYTGARSLAGPDRLRRSRLCRKMGLVRDHQGRFATAQRWFSRGISELLPVSSQAEAQGLRAELTNAAVTSRMRQGRITRAVPLLERAIADAEAAGNHGALARAYCVLDQILFAQGRYTEATHSNLAASIYESLGNHRGAAEAYNEKGTTAYWCGRWDEAVADYERAMQNNRLAGGLVHVAINLNNIGEIRSDQGRLEEASELLEQARVLWAGAGWRDAAAWAVSNLGRVASRAGRDDEAGARLAEAGALLADLGVDPLLLQTEAREVERHVLAGRHELALRLIDEMAPRVERAGQANVAVMLDRLAG